MDIAISMMLVLLACFFTVLLFMIDKDPEVSEAFTLVFCIVSIVFWIIAGISFTSLSSSVSHVVDNAVVTHVIYFSDSWLLILPVSMLGSVYPFFLILKKVWSSWGF